MVRGFLSDKLARAQVLVGELGEMSQSVHLTSFWWVTVEVEPLAGSNERQYVCWWNYVNMDTQCAG